MVQGYSQQKGVDYDKTFSPTGRLRVLRFMLCEAAADSRIKTAQWDCSNAFLHAEPDHDMYMRQPPGFQDGSSRLCLLLKCLYGTKQAPRQFFRLVRKTLLDFGATQSAVDECFFLVRRGESWVKLLVHVDDFAVSYLGDDLYAELLAHMQDTFKLTPQELHHFLGMAIDSEEGGAYTIHQGAYIDTLLERLGLGSAPPASTPMLAGSSGKLTSQKGPVAPDVQDFMSTVPYREAVGALFYLARCSRWDISHAAQQVARFMANPNPQHWAAVQRIYRYLKGTRDVKLRFCPGQSPTLQGFSDADWAGCPDTHKSHTGWLLFWGGALLAWQSRRQGGVAQSSAEAEMVAGCALGNEIFWWRRFLTEIGYSFSGPTSIYIDNTGTVALAEHAGNFEKTKHFSVRATALREYQNNGVVSVKWIATAKQLADIMTKGLPPAKFLPIFHQVQGFLT